MRLSTGAEPDIRLGMVAGNLTDLTAAGEGV
jgi:hypothetical protein